MMHETTDHPSIHPSILGQNVKRFLLRRGFVYPVQQLLPFFFGEF